MAILLFALFRRLSAVFLPLVVTGLSVLSTFGTMAIMGKPLGIPTQILPSFLLAVGVGGAVHLLVIFFQRFDAGAPRSEALAYALGHSGLAIVMTGLTTAGGLASFAAGRNRTGGRPGHLRAGGDPPGAGRTAWSCCRRSFRWFP